MSTGGRPGRPPVRLASRRIAPGWARILAFGLAVALVVALDPNRRDIPLCPLHAMTGLLCPLCGSLRAINHLAHGHVVAALHSNVVLTVGLPVALAFWLWRERIIGRLHVARSSSRARRIATYVAIAVLFAFTVARNLPIGGELRPG